MTPIGQVNLDELEGDEQDKPETRKDRQRRAQGETGLKNRLRECFDGIADALDERGDPELGGIVREDAGVLASGIISLTQPIKPFRTVVVVFVSVIEPALAFGRILRVLVARWAERRAQAQAEAEAQQAGQPPTEFVT